MPKITNDNFLSAYQVLYTKCGICENELSIAHLKGTFSLIATCCLLVYRISPLDATHRTFHVEIFDVDEKNVIPLRRKVIPLRRK